MKLDYLIFISSFFVIGCKSNDDSIQCGEGRDAPASKALSNIEGKTPSQKWMDNIWFVMDRENHVSVGKLFELLDRNGINVTRFNMGGYVFFEIEKSHITREDLLTMMPVDLKALLISREKIARYR